jgi:hypothetical protein
MQKQQHLPTYRYCNTWRKKTTFLTGLIIIKILNTMKHIFTIYIIAVTAAFIGGYFTGKDSTPPVDYSMFRDFEILEPDYAHTDTLVVINGGKLSEAFAKYNPGTDAEIADLLYKHSIPMNDTLRQAYIAATIGCNIIDMSILNDVMKNLVIDYYLE